MAVLRQFISILAIAGSALAQGGGGGNGCSTRGTMTISAPADVTSLSSCPTFTGSIAVNKRYSGDLALDGPRTITGDLLVDEVNGISSLSSSSLETIEGRFRLNALGSLVLLSFPMLAEVDQIEWTSLSNSALTSLDFGTGVRTLRTLSVQATNFLSLSGIIPDSAESVDIGSNTNIQSLSLPFTNVRDLLSIRGNFGGLRLSLQRLRRAGNVIITDCSSISMPNFEEAEDGLSIFENSGIRSLSLPKFSEGGSFSCNGNAALTSLSVPNLERVVGALDIQNNTRLSSTISLPGLESVGGSASFVGTFNNLNLPELRQIQGDLIISSTKNIESVCNKFTNLPQSVILNQPSCKGKADNANDDQTNGNNNGGNGNGGSGGDGGNGGGDGAAGHNRASLTAVFSMLLGLGVMLVAVL